MEGVIGQSRERLQSQIGYPVVVGDNENGPRDNNIGTPIDSHLIIPVIPREKEK
jgi:hypothetical protein